MERISIEAYNELVAAGRISNLSVDENKTETVIYQIQDDDNVEIFRHHNAIALYWGGCGHLYSVYVS